MWTQIFRVEMSPLLSVKGAPAPLTLRGGTVYTVRPLTREQCQKYTKCKYINITIKVSIKQ